MNRPHLPWIKKKKSQRQRLFCALCLFVSLFISPCGFGQAVENLDSLVIKTETTQIPYSKQNRDIVVIRRAVLKKMPVRSVNDLLSYVAGIDVRQRGVMDGQADISINGGTFDETLILLNGMKIIDPQTGHNMMNLPISLDDIERVEILKGSAASFYGVNAINGAINIVTRQPQKTGVGVHITSGTSFKKDSTNHRVYAGLRGNIHGSLKTTHSAHYISAGSIQSNGYRHNTALHNTKVFYKNHLTIGKSQWQMIGGYVDDDYGANGFYAAPNDPEAKEISKAVIGAVQGRLNLSDHWQLQPGMSYRYASDDYILVKQHPEIYENKHYTNVYDAHLNNLIYTDIGNLGFGLEFRHAEISSNSLGNHARSNFGIFAHYSLTMIPNTLIHIGLYANYNPDFGWDWLPSVDLGYTINPYFRIFANATTGMRLPTYTDLYYTGPVNVGNPDLQPEKAWQIEGGLKYHRYRFRASVNYFHRNTKDFIDWVKDSLSAPWQSRNYQNIATEGISLKAGYQIIPLQEKDFNLRASLAYTYLNPTVKQESSHLFSHYALENLKHQLTGRINMGFLWRFNFNIGMKYEQRVSYKDYLLLSARLSVKLDAFRVYLNVDNLTDVSYIEAGAVPLPGRWVALGIKWHWWK